MKSHQIRGFGLIEVLLTLAMIAIGLVGLYKMQLQSSRLLHEADNQMQAIWLLDDLANRIRANNQTHSAYQSAGVSCLLGPNKYCSASYMAGQRIAAALDCSSVEQAQFDLWEVACALPEQQLPELKLTVNSVTAGSLRLTMQWQSLVYSELNTASVEVKP